MIQDLLFRLEAARTNLADQIALFRGMHGQVFLVAEQRSVLLLAPLFLARVDLLLRAVHFYVVLQVVLPVERPLAHATTERFPVRVDQGVPHQLELGSEALLAVLALERRRTLVRLLVPVELLRAGEILLAHVTGVRLLGLFRGLLPGLLGGFRLQSRRSGLVQAGRDGEKRLQRLGRRVVLGLGEVILYGGLF